jgi:regulator of replication initiation timing
MIDTKAVRALADKQANVWTPIGWEADVANMLRQCADEIDTLRAENAAISKSRWELGVQVGRLEIECDTLRADNQRAWNKCAELEIERDTLRAENSTIKSVLSLVPGKCLYCGLEDIAKCPSGFPGCARADDMLCGEDEASRRLIEERDALRAENDLLRAIGQKSIETIEWQRREKETLRELVREALWPEASYDWSRRWRERAEKALK